MPSVQANNSSTSTSTRPRPTNKMQCRRWETDRWALTGKVRSFKNSNRGKGAHLLTLGSRIRRRWSITSRGAGMSFKKLEPSQCTKSLEKAHRNLRVPGYLVFIKMKIVIRLMRAKRLKTDQRLRKDQDNRKLDLMIKGPTIGKDIMNKGMRTDQGLKTRELLIGQESKTRGLSKDQESKIQEQLIGQESNTRGLRKDPESKILDHKIDPI